MKERLFIRNGGMQTIVRSVVVLTAALAATACQTIGSGSVPRDRLWYAGAIAESWKELMLLNIVKLRQRCGPQVYGLGIDTGAQT